MSEKALKLLVTKGWLVLGYVCGNSKIVFIHRVSLNFIGVGCMSSGALLDLNVKKHSKLIWVSVNRIVDCTTPSLYNFWVADFEMPEAFGTSLSFRNKSTAFNKSRPKTDPNVERHIVLSLQQKLSQMQFWTTLTWKRGQLERLWSFPLRLQSFSTCSAQSDAKLAFTFALKAAALSHVNNLSHYIFAHRQSVFDSLWMFPSFSLRLPLKWLNFFTASMNGYGKKECS